MYDKSRVSKLTHFVYFVLKFIERLSSEKDFGNIIVKSHLSDTCTHITCEKQKLEEMKDARPECSYLEDTFRYNHCYMCAVYSTLLCI